MVMNRMLVTISGSIFVRICCAKDPAISNPGFTFDPTKACIDCIVMACDVARPSKTHRFLSPGWHSPPNFRRDGALKSQCSARVNRLDMVRTWGAPYGGCFMSWMIWMWPSQKTAQAPTTKSPGCRFARRAEAFWISQQRKVRSSEDPASLN